MIREPALFVVEPRRPNLIGWINTSTCSPSGSQGDIIRENPVLGRKAQAGLTRDSGLFSDQAIHVYVEFVADVLVDFPSRTQNVLPFE